MQAKIARKSDPGREPDGEDPLSGHHVTSGTRQVEKFGTPTQRNPNRCAECGRLWLDGVVKPYTIDGKHVRLCVICKGKAG